MFGMDGLNSDIIKQAKQLRNPAESEALQLWANSLAQVEHDLQTALRGHQQALGIEGPVEPVDVDERQDEILAFAEAYLSRDVEAFWLAEQAPEELDAEKARPYLGMPAEAWSEQQSAWVEKYRDQAGSQFEDVSDEQIVAAHVTRAFGVSLDEFEGEIVEWSRAGALREAIMGRFELVESNLEQATAAVESGDLEG